MTGDRRQRVSIADCGMRNGKAKSIVHGVKAEAGREAGEFRLRILVRGFIRAHFIFSHESALAPYISTENSGKFAF